MLVAAFWYLIIRRLETLVRWLAVVWARVAQYTVVKGLQRSLGGWSWLVVYLTAYVVIAFSAAVIGLVLFVELADEVEAGEDIAAFDDTFTTSLRTSITL
jgi:hypothetical protein